MDSSTAREAAQGMYAALRASRGQGSQASLTQALCGLQEIRNMIDACQTEALGQLAAIEVVTLEDGTLGERHHLIGHAELDAPELAAPCLGVSVHVAAARMSTALTQVSNTPALVVEMATGRLDGARPKVITDELADAPAGTAAAVVAELITHARRAGSWLESAGPLRRRTTTVLTRIDPAWVKQRLTGERGRRGLRRSIESSALDRWEGVYPVEEARLAWEAVDTLARQLKRDGHADTLTQARADAHLQLLLSQVSTTIHLHPTLPAHHLTDTQPPPDDDIATTTASPAEAAKATLGLVTLGGYAGLASATMPAAWVEHALATGRAVIAGPLHCHPDTGASGADGVESDASQPDVPAEDQYRPSSALRAQVQARDGTCRFPGCHIQAKFCDLDHVRPWPTSPANLITLCRRHHRIKQRPGWTLRLHPDATTEWTDPTGTVRSSHPIDHLAPTRPLLNPPPRHPAAKKDSTAAAPSDDGAHDGFDTPYDIESHSPLIEHYLRRLADHLALPAADRSRLRTVAAQRDWL